MANLQQTKHRKKTANKGQFKKGDDPRRHRFTAEERKRAGQKGKGNLVPFAPGYDPRRHVLTQEECSKGGERGFKTIEQTKPWVLLWLKKQIKARGAYRRYAGEVCCE